MRDDTTAVELSGRRAQKRARAYRANATHQGCASFHVDADKRFTHDGPIWTSAGVTAGIDLTLALVKQDSGDRVATETARQLVIFIKRSGLGRACRAP